MSCYPYNSVRPCLMKNGKVVGYLQKNNFAKFEDGSSADITSGNAGDVMIEIPRFYYRVYTSGSYTYVEISSTITDGFTDLPFQVSGSSRRNMYVGAYMGYVDSSNELRSLSGKTPTGNKPIGAFRTAAQANGSGYQQIHYYTVVALQILYLLAFKNLDSQTALGQGFTASSNSAAHTTGTHDTKGMYYGTSSGSTQVKFLGIEDFFGNLRQWVDGFVYTSSGAKIGTGGFNDTGLGYASKTFTTSSTGHFSKVVGTNDAPFIASTGNGSDSTYYCDYFSPGSDFVPLYGGCWNFGLLAGAFFFYSNSAGSYSDQDGSRLRHEGDV